MRKTSSVDITSMLCESSEHHFASELSQMITKLHHCWNMVMSTQAIIMFYFSIVLFVDVRFYPEILPFLFSYALLRLQPWRPQRLEYPGL